MTHDPFDNGEGAHRPVKVRATGICNPNNSGNPYEALVLPETPVDRELTVRMSEDGLGGWSAFPSIY
jgi:hypothetical protein